MKMVVVVGNFSSLFLPSYIRILVITETHEKTTSYAVDGRDFVE